MAEAASAGAAHLLPSAKAATATAPWLRHIPAHTHAPQHTLDIRCAASPDASPPVLRCEVSPTPFTTCPLGYHSRAARVVFRRRRRGRWHLTKPSCSLPSPIDHRVALEHRALLIAVGNTSLAAVSHQTPTSPLAPRHSLAAPSTRPATNQPAPLTATTPIDVPHHRPPHCPHAQSVPYCGRRLHPGQLCVISPLATRHSLFPRLARQLTNLP